MINGMPALRVGDSGIHAACCGANTWTASTGSATVFINGKAAHRVSDMVTHCGVTTGQLIEGSSNVFIGDAGAGSAVVGGGGGTGGSAAGGFFSSLIQKVEQFLGLVPPSVTPGPANLQAMVQSVNPNPAPSDQNCGYITDAEYQRLTGANPNAIALKADGRDISQMAADYHTTLSAPTHDFQNAFNAVQSGGDGTKALVFITRPDGSGHVVLMTNQDGKAYVLEGQDWGPGEPPEVISSVDRANYRYADDGKNSVYVAVIPSQTQLSPNPYVVSSPTATPAPASSPASQASPAPPATESPPSGTQPAADSSSSTSWMAPPPLK
jgi:hypothetical protein